MPSRLKNRNSQIPNGLTFLVPETNWRPARYASFDAIVNGLIAHRRGRPDLVASKGWSLNYEAVADEVDAFNALICVRHGWNDYVMGDEGVAPPPKSQALLQQERSQVAAAAGRAKKIWAGVKTANEWIDSGSPPVPKATSEIRALACAACPKNGKGDFTSWFTKPASEVIGRQIERISGMKLTTSVDDKLNVCEVCLCPLKVKVHTPKEYIKNHTTSEVLIELSQIPGCWIPKELNA
jgi:hypothetical protein